MPKMPLLSRMHAPIGKRNHGQGSLRKAPMTLLMLFATLACVNWTGTRQRHDSDKPQAGAVDVQQEATQETVVIYTKEYCPYCIKAKALLSKKGVTFVELDVEHNPAQRKEMIERSKRFTVPQIFVGDTHVGGLDDFERLDAQGKFDPLLRKK